jgi:hypothetical protein
LQRAEIMADVQTASRPHTTQYSLTLRQFCSYFAI